MPRLQPFTVLCQQLARRPVLDRADLHLHTIHSDGTYTPAEVVDLARRCGLCAIAVTDHDTLEGVEPARRAAGGTGLEVIAAVEISTEHEGRELHLLAYFVSLEEGPLTEALRRLRQLRRERFGEMVDRLRSRGIHLEGDRPGETALDDALGRRHLAEMMVRQKKVGTMREAFQRYLRDGGPANVPKSLLPVAEAIAAVCAAGGVAVWAHPPERITLCDLARLRALGLGGVEAVYPSFRAGRVKELRALAHELDLATTGGSDCHGPDAPRRAVGACSVTRQELEALRGRARRFV
jgi:3',5'-nucleoside bisphosphate phosphatase